MSKSSFEPNNEILDILSATDEEPDWLVPELLLQGTMNILAGDAGAGKSYISYTLGLAIAAGQGLFGGLVQPGEPKRVLYFDEENSKQDRDKYLRRSYEGLHVLNHAEPDYGLLYTNFWPIHFYLGGEDWFDRAQEWVEHINPHLIIFDTATPCFNIEDENDNGKATQVMKQVRQLMAVPEPIATALILKHAKVVTERGGRRTIRGAKAWKSGADQLMFQVKSAGRPRKDGLSLTRLEPDKTRAYGLSRTVYITPDWTDDERTGLLLRGSYDPDKEHKKREDAELDDE